MLSIGLTGGIASGKSVVASRLAELGAVLIDADLLAREVVEPGTPGLDEVADAFGDRVLDKDGTLDRAALGEVVFDDQQARERLNAIIHPRVRAEASRRIAAAPADAIVVQDIPLLVETGRQAAFQLVIVVEAPESMRLARMVSNRDMTERQAASRIQAQADDHQRRAAADVLIDNSAGLEDTLAAVDGLWRQRLIPFESNLRNGRRALCRGPVVLCDYDPTWPDVAGRMAARLRRAGGKAVLAVDHIGSTAIDGMPAKDVIDLQVTVADLDDADGFADAFAGVGFPPLEGPWQDNPHVCDPDPGNWHKRLHGSSDPARPANIHVRQKGSPGWKFALAFRDWMRDDDDAAAQYAAEKRKLAAAHSGDASPAGYARDKEPWFTGTAYPALIEWATENRWEPPE